MLQIIIRLERLAALRQCFLDQKMLVGSTAGYIAQLYHESDNLNDDGDIFMKDGNSDLIDTNANNTDDEQPLSTEGQDARKEQL